MRKLCYLPFVFFLSLWTQTKAMLAIKTITSAANTPPITGNCAVWKHEKIRQTRVFKVSGTLWDLSWLAGMEKGIDYIESTTAEFNFHLLMYQGWWLTLGLVAEVFDCFFLPTIVFSVVGGTVVGSTHRVLFSLYTHLAICVPLEMQLMKMKPRSKPNYKSCMDHNKN